MGVRPAGFTDEWIEEARSQYEQIAELGARKLEAARRAAEAYLELEEVCAELNQRDDTIVWHRAHSTFQTEVEHLRAQRGGQET